jgi:hypothetical protein
MVDLVPEHQNRLHRSGRQIPADHGFDGMHTGKKRFFLKNAID